MKYTVYTKPACAQCDQAKMLLKSKGIEFDEIYFDVGQPQEDGKTYINVAEFKTQYPTATSAPQIFLGGERIGGLMELRKKVA